MTSHNVVNADNMQNNAKYCIEINSLVFGWDDDLAVKCDVLRYKTSCYFIACFSRKRRYLELFSMKVCEF